MYSEIVNNSEIEKSLKDLLDNAIEEGIREDYEPMDVVDKLISDIQDDKFGIYESVFLDCGDLAVDEGIVDEDYFEDNSNWDKFTKEISSELADKIESLYYENQSEYDSQKAEYDKEQENDRKDTEFLKSESYKW